MLVLHFSNRALDMLYRVFARYQKVEPDLLCHCCHDRFEREAQARPLTRPPLREVPRDALDECLWRFRTADVFRRFLPRMLELSLLAPDRLLARLQEFRFHFWPADERDAVKAFVTEFTPGQLSDRHLDAGLAHDVVELAHWVLGDPRPVLEAMLLGRDAPMTWYAALWVNFAQASLRGRTDATGAQVVVDWLLENPRAAQLEQAFFAAPDDARVQQLISDALQVIAWFAPTVTEPSGAGGRLSPPPHATCRTSASASGSAPRDTPSRLLSNARPSPNDELQAARRRSPEEYLSAFRGLLTIWRCERVFQQVD